VTDPTLDRAAKQAELRATSDQLLLAIDAVSVLERQKRGVEPGDDQFVQLAKDVRVAAEALLTLAHGEEEVARELHAAPEGRPMPTIEETAGPPSLARTLERWREVERRIADAKPGSDEAGRLLIEFEQLRREYAATLTTIVSRGGEDREPTD
jgi:hypothetical protein